jgi:hypothetical protein
VTPAQAQALFARMRTAFPQAPVKDGTLKVYLQTLTPWGHESGAKAVESAIETCRFFPSIADLHHHYAFVREQKRRELGQERRRLERLAEDNAPHVELRDIPSVQEHLAKLRGNGGAEPLVHLEEVSEGLCDDCMATARDQKEPGPRFAFYSLALCSRCVAHRLRVKAQVEAA